MHRNLQGNAGFMALTLRQTKKEAKAEGKINQRGGALPGAAR